MGSDRVSELKKIRNKINSLNTEIENIEKNISNSVTKRNSLLEDLQVAETALYKLNLSEPKVTDHAMLRLLERYENLNREELIAKILPENVKQNIIKMGDGEYSVNNKFRIVVKENRVVTVK